MDAKNPQTSSRDSLYERMGTLQRYNISLKCKQKL